VHGVEAGAVKVAGELGVLYKCTTSNEILESVLGDEVVMFAIDFAGAGETGGVYNENRSGTEEEVEVECGRETLKPKKSG
jgi:hypothetical protein